MKKRVVLFASVVALMLFLIAVALYVFPVLSRFQAGSRDLIKSSAVMSVKHSGNTLFMLVVTLGVMTIVVLGWKFFPLILLLGPSIYMLIISKHTHMMRLPFHSLAKRAQEKM